MRVLGVDDDDDVFGVVVDAFEMIIDEVDDEVGDDEVENSLAAVPPAAAATAVF